MAIELHHGDCLEIMQDIPDKSIDMILCDLPYGTTACKWDVVIPFEPLWKEYKRIIKDRGCIALFGSEPFSSYLRMSNIKDYKYDWIWKKNYVTGQFLAKRQPLKDHELISIFYNKQCLYNRQMIKRTPEEFKVYYRKNPTVQGKSNHLNNGKETKTRHSIERQWYKPPTRIINFNCERFKNINQHPTQKPVQLLEYLIRTYTLETETVLDNTMGSGSTGVACINIDRNFIGIEKEEKYFNIAEKRIEDAQNNKQGEFKWL